MVVFWLKFTPPYTTSVVLFVNIPYNGWISRYVLANSPARCNRRVGLFARTYRLIRPLYGILTNKTTDVVIQQHSCKLLMMDILMSETCWAHKKWNKIASDKLVFYSSTITMVHGPINISFVKLCLRLQDLWFLQWCFQELWSSGMWHCVAG